MLRVVFLLFAALCLNGAYLAGVTFLEWRGGRLLQDYGYQLMFLAHLVLGLLLIPPVVGVVVASGFVLIRFDFFQVNHPQVRGSAYWIHVLSPFLAAALFIGHRLAGPAIRWRAGAGWLAASGLATAGLIAAVQLTSSEVGPAAARESDDRLHRRSRRPRMASRSARTR
jgi:hypothetical protein